ncbi:glutamate receptor 2.8-like [Cynara cardunculus var. scolymus]|uniref:glutamate receptor 2.8-like n=1 Tax=Cynara cardunculus var. scolymus TaxID=59895 RepID=UPI000D627911|nr:glutamate receptor 2.8-like [Cynara cardunculus var. scolymus]
MKRIKGNLIEMHNFKSYLMVSLVAFLLPCFLLTTGSLAVPPEVRNETGTARIGVILGQTSRPGKEAKVSIEIAIQDFNIRTNRSSVLYLQNSLNKPSRAAIAECENIAAKELIDEHGVKAILGAHTCEEASAIAEVISEADHDIPLFLSLADTTPLQASDQSQFLVQVVPTQSTQMNAVAAILQARGIQQVTLIYETSHLASPSSSIISHLSQAFRQTGSELAHTLPFTSGSCFLNKELEVLKRQKRQVFIIHTSLELGICLFQTAKKLEMTGDGYLWIATNEITDLFHSINSTMISSLKGMVGVKSYFPENTPDFLDFRKRFRQKFRSDYPEEEQDEPGIFAVQGYNAVKLLEKDSPENFHHRRPIPATTVEIVSVIGKGYHSIYWTKGLGFSETIDDINGATTYTHSMDNVGLWPVQPWYAHRRHRNLAESSKNLMTVGVPGQSLFNQFVKVEVDSERNRTSISGFVVAVFDEMMKNMSQSYVYKPFFGSYDELIEGIHSEKFDAVAGDVTIVSRRHEFADFTQPYTESGLEMIVPVRPRISNQAWLFLKPFTPEMWWLIAAITIYNGFIIWLIERKHSENLRGSVITQTGIVFSLAFTTLFTLPGERLHSNLSRMAMVVWLFVALIITASYTASLASMLTAQRLEPTITSVETLRNMNATVGYCNGSFINYYLKEVLHFEDVKVKSYNSTHRYAEALNGGEIAAIFLEVPAAKVFLAQYCNSFIRTGETFKVGGFGFAFPRDFPRLSDANKALMHVAESGKLKELEDAHLISEKCVDEESSPDEESRLSFRSFSALFMITGGTSTIALAIYIMISIREFKKSTQEHTSFIKLISAFIKDWQHHMRRSSSIVVNVESGRHTRNADQLTQDDMDGL